IAEFYLERKKDKGIVGNIYKGRVTRVLPGMQAAFVDIGLDKAAFLYVTDVFYDPDLSRAQFELTEGEHEDAPELPELTEHPEDSLPHPGQEVDLAPTDAAPPEPIAPEVEVTPTAVAPMEAFSGGAAPAIIANGNPVSEAPAEAAPVGIPAQVPPYS